jgi:hypothetical protein
MVRVGPAGLGRARRRRHRLGLRRSSRQFTAERIPTSVAASSVLARWRASARSPAPATATQHALQMPALNQVGIGAHPVIQTADTYTRVLLAAKYQAAEASARLVLDAARNDRGKIATVARRTRGRSTNVRRGIIAHTDGRPAVIAAYRLSVEHPKRSPAVATARQPPCTQNLTNSYIHC